jgi:hypothetical protein
MGENTQIDLDLDISELTHPPRRRTLSFYLVLLFAVVPIWSIVPLSWLFVINTLRTGIIWSFGFRAKICFAVALCEVGIHRKRLARCTVYVEC